MCIADFSVKADWKTRVACCPSLDSHKILGAQILFTTFKSNTKLEAYKKLIAAQQDLKM